MLSGTRYGTLSLSSFLFNKRYKASALFSFSSNPTRPSSLPIAQPPQGLSQAVATSPASIKICSLLSNSVQSTRNIDSLLKDYKDILNSHIVLQVLMNYRQLGKLRTLEFFSWAGMQMGFRFDDCVTEYMVDFLGRRKLFDDMKCFLITLLLHEGSVSCRAFSICIRFLGRQGRFREALCLFQEMEAKFRCKPDNIVYNNLLYVLCKKETSGDLIDVALGIFQRIESPDTYSYSNLLVGLCKFGRFETAIKIFHEMGRVGLLPTRSATNVLISKLCSLSEKEGAMNKVRVKDSHRPFTILVPNVGSKNDAIRPAVGVFWAVYDLGLLPSSFVIIQLIEELCRLGKIEGAVEILNVVEDRKLNCAEKGCSIVIQALCERGLAEEAGHLFRRMLSLEMKPTLVVYNSIICMLCKLGSLDSAQKVFEMMHKERCLPDNVTYTALVHAYSEARNWKDAYGLLIEMLGMGLIPHFNTYALVDKQLREQGQMDLLFNLERKLRSQILYKHCKMGQLKAAYTKLRSMLEKGLFPSMYVRDAFEQAFQKHGKLKIAHELLQKMDKTHGPER